MKEYNFPKNLLNLLINNNLDIKDFANKVGIALMTAYNWINGSVYPSLYYTMKIADYFDKTLDELVYGEIK